VARRRAPFFAQGVIHKVVQGLVADRSFAQAIDLVSPHGDLAYFLSELTELSASLYLAHSSDLIAFVHAVTAPSALRGAHTIKFTEACLREYAVNPQPVYLVAARDVTERVGDR
jgi:hypothetical protein